MLFYAAFIFVMMPFFFHAQELAPSQMSQQEYDDACYLALSTGMKLRFEYARENDNSIGNKVLAQLVSGDTPYIPAVRVMATRALMRGNTDEALATLEKGVSFYDFPCMLCKASLLLNANKVPSLSKYDPVSIEASGQEMLWHAAQNVLFHDGAYYYSPIAREYWNTMQEESQTRLRDAFKKMLNRIPSHLPEYARASFLLGWIDYQRLDQGEPVDLAELERNLEAGSRYNVCGLLLLASYAAQPVDMLAYANRVMDSLDTVDPRMRIPVVADMINLYYSAGQKGENKFGKGLVRLLKHKTYVATHEQICNDPDLAAELGIKLLRMKDLWIAGGKISTSPDCCTIQDVGHKLITAAADKGNDRAAWELVARSSSGQVDVCLQQAMARVESNNKEKKSLLVPAENVRMLLAHCSTAHSLSDQTYEAIARWYLHGIDGYLERNESLAVSYIARLKNPIPVLNHAIETQALYDPAVCLQAAIMAHKHNPMETLAQNLFFGKAILSGTVQVKKEVAEYALQYKELVPVACNALAPLYEELAHAAYRSQKEGDEFREKVIQPLSNKLMKWAVGTHYTNSPDNVKAEDRHPAAIMFFNDRLLLDSFSDSDKRIMEGLAEWAAFNGYSEAVDALEAKFKEPKKETKDIVKAVAYWGSWITLYKAVPEKAQKLKAAYDIVTTLSNWTLEPGQNKEILSILHPRTHYQLANLFMEKDPVRAVTHILAIEQAIKSYIMHDPHILAIINDAGTYDMLRVKAAQGIDWACYALIAIELNRLEMFTEDHYADPEQCLRRVDMVKDLFNHAKTFDITQLDSCWRRENNSETGCRVITMAAIEYHAANVADIIMRRSGKNEKLAKRALAELESAIGANYPDAMFTWADMALNGAYGVGQQVFEKAINYMCKSAQMGLKESADHLACIHKMGFAYQPLCGGTVTHQMREQMDHIVKQNGKLELASQNIAATPAPVSEFEQAVTHLNNKERISDALATFEKLSVSGDPRAHVYLGLMHRDGIGMPLSNERAQEYFLRALRESRSVRNNFESLRVVNIAYEALRDAAKNNLIINAERCKYQLDIIAIDGQFNANFKVVIHDIEVLERKLNASSEKETQNLLFSTGLMKSLAELCANVHTPSLCLRVAKLCASRLLKSNFSKEHDVENGNAKNSDLSLLTLPFAALGDYLLETGFKYENVCEAYSGLSHEEVESMFSLLELLVARGYQEPFEQTLGSLKVTYGILRRDIKLANEGMRHWEHAEKEGDLRAAYMWALVKLRGEHIGTKNFFTKAPKVGLEKLKAIAAKGHIPAYGLMGSWYLEVQEPKKALESYKQMLSVKPNLPHGAIGFLEAIAMMHTKPTEEDRALIMNAIQVTQKSDDLYRIRGALCAAYLRLVKEYEGISEEQMLDFIIDNATTYVAKEDPYSLVQKFLNDTQLNKKFALWLEKVQSKDTVSVDFKVKAHLAHALLLITERSGKLGDIDVEQKILDDCDKALKLKPDSLQAEAIKALVHYTRGINGTAESIPVMKLSVNKSCKILNDNKLTLDASPLIGHLLSLISRQGATVGSLRNGNHIVTTPDTLLKLFNDKEWAKAIVEKYKAKS